MMATVVSKSTRVTLLLLLVGLVGLIPVVRRTLARGLYLLAMGHLGQFHDYLLSLGRWAPLVSIVLMISQAVAIPLPVTFVMVANGVVFGVWGGMLVSFAGGLGGSAAAYFLGRRLGRLMVEGFIPHKALDTAEQLMARYGNWAVVLGRWVPGIPCDPVSYAAGITRMPVSNFLVLTALGLAPANLVTAYLGAQATSDLETSYWLLSLAGLAALWGGWKLLNRQREATHVHADAP
jgi:uncharacterized membrane protein YdjX (TVP38/TMEM64 family)